MTLVGYGVLVGIPVISTAWVGLLGFSEEQVGRVVGADLGGLAAGAIVTAFFIKRFNRRWIAFFGILIAIVANGACMIFQDYHVVWLLRLISGFGGGIYTAVAVATLGGGTHPARSYTLMMLAFAFSQALEMHLLPKLPMNGIYLVFILFFLSTVPFLSWIPKHPVVHRKDPDSSTGTLHNERFHPSRKSASRFLPWLCMVAIFLTYINIGAYWTYIELAALQQGIAESWIVPLLTWVSLGSIAGCLVAMVISDRFGISKPLLFSLVGMALIVGLLGIEINHTSLIISLSMFNLLWIFIDVYQMSTIAVIDRTGTFASLLPASQGLGNIVGPNIAASMLGSGSAYHQVFLMCMMAVSLGFFFYLMMYLSLRKKIPELTHHVEH